MRGLCLPFGSCLLASFLAIGCSQSPEDSADDGEGGEGEPGGAGGDAEGGAGGGEAEGGSGGAEMGGAGVAGMGGAGEGMGGMMAAPDPNCPGKGMKVKVMAGQSVAAALMASKGGEIIELGDGDHGSLSFGSGNFPCETMLRAENPHKAQLASLTVSDTKNLHLASLKTTGTVTIERTAGLKLANFQMTADKVCLRIKSGENVVIEGNTCKNTDKSSYAVHVLGDVKKAVVTRNLIEGGPYERAAAVAEGAPPPGGGFLLQGATGKQRLDGVVISNNVVRSFWNGILLSQTNNVDVVNNTFIEMTTTIWDQSKERTENVIVIKNERLRIWNNVMHAGHTAYTIWLWLVGHREEHNATNKLPAPLLHSHNAVAKVEARQGNHGGTGANAITGTLNLDESWKPRAGSPLVGAGLKNADTPTVDFAGKPRGDKPSVGALEP